MDAGRQLEAAVLTPGCPRTPESQHKFIIVLMGMHEMLLAPHLAQSSDARMRRSVIMQVLGTYHHNFVTHLLEAELQHRVCAQAEAGQAVTAQLLNECKGDILAGFWGDAVEIDDGARMTWMRQPHYYMGLYPYTYSVGLVAATRWPAGWPMRARAPLSAGCRC